jgi:quercetin dioxygenase-like cupin family protein
MGGEYFEREPAPPGTAPSPGRYVQVEGIDPVEFTEGLAFQPVLGERLLVNFVRFEPRTTAPVHTHEEEQVSIMVEGELEFDLDGDVRTLRPGSAVVIPPHVPHGARTLDSTCFEIDVFSPPRRALIDVARRARPNDDGSNRSD